VTATGPCSKAAVLRALRARLDQDLKAVTQAQQRTQNGATHEESRPENDKDTRALEASYLARGQARRVQELEGATALMAALELREFGEGAGAALTALLDLDDGDRCAKYFLAPAGGGLELDVEGTRVKVVTPQSPLGRALIGCRVGDVVELETPQGRREYDVAALV
jgi:hypothetical protein